MLIIFGKNIRDTNKRSNYRPNRKKINAVTIRRAAVKIACRLFFGNERKRKTQSHWLGVGTNVAMSLGHWRSLRGHWGQVTPTSLDMQLLKNSAKNAPINVIFTQKIQKFSGEGAQPSRQTPSPVGRRHPSPCPTLQVLPLQLNSGYVTALGVIALRGVIRISGNITV